MNLEVVVIPVSNVDRSKEFYARLGWRLTTRLPGTVDCHDQGPFTSTDDLANALRRAEAAHSQHDIARMGRWNPSKNWTEVEPRIT